MVQKIENPRLQSIPASIDSVLATLIQRLQHSLEGGRKAELDKLVKAGLLLGRKTPLALLAYGRKCLPWRANSGNVCALGRQIIQTAPLAPPDNTPTYVLLILSVSMEVSAMKSVNAYIEPLPKGDGPTESFQIEFADNSAAKGPYPTQKAAIEAAKKMGHKPLIPRVRITDKGNPDHWRHE